MPPTTQLGNGNKLEFLYYVSFFVVLYLVSVVLYLVTCILTQIRFHQVPFSFQHNLLKVLISRLKSIFLFPRNCKFLCLRETGNVNCLNKLHLQFTRECGTLCRTAGKRERYYDYISSQSQTSSSLEKTYHINGNSSSFLEKRYYIYISPVRDIFFNRNNMKHFISFFSYLGDGLLAADKQQHVIITQDITTYF